MQDKKKTKEQLLEELQQLHRQVADLESAKAELNRAKKALREYRENIQALFDHANDCLFLVDFNGNILKTNREISKKQQATNTQKQGSPCP